MKAEAQDTTRKQFLTATTAAAGAATLFSAGFNRTAEAAHHEAGEKDEIITQTAAFGLNAEMKDEALEGLAKLVAAVEKNEPGVLTYICHQAGDDKIFFFEIFKNQAAIEAHGEQPHMAILSGLLQSGALTLDMKDIVRLTRVAGFSR